MIDFLVSLVLTVGILVFVLNLGGLLLWVERKVEMRRGRLFRWHLRMSTGRLPWKGVVPASNS